MLHQSAAQAGLGAGLMPRMSQMEPERTSGIMETGEGNDDEPDTGTTGSAETDDGEKSSE